jgi:ketol-acid reductoisomerase
MPCAKRPLPRSVLPGKNASENGFTVGTYQELIPEADLVLNLTPDKQHSAVVAAVMPLMKHGACLSYSHGFNIVEEGMQVRDDITVIMVAPSALARKCAKSTNAALAYRR